MAQQSLKPVNLVTELSVPLVNKPGRFAAVCAALAKEKVNILAMTLSDVDRRGLLRLVVDDVKKATAALTRVGSESRTNRVLAVALPNRPGALAGVAETLAEAHIDIDYAYCSAGGKGGKALGILSVKHPEPAMKLLRGKQGKAHKDRPALGRRTSASA